MTDAVIVHKPQERATHLMLTFHGVGGQPRDLQPLGQRLAPAFPGAFIVSIPGVHRSDFGSGFQWFSVRGVTEANRADRVVQAMPAFRDAVRYWQKETGMQPQDTTLIGFSQGAIMALEATKHEPPLAGIGVDVLPAVGHEINPQVVEAVLRRLGK